MLVLATTMLAVSAIGGVPEELPLVVRKDMVYAEEMCRALGVRFLFDSDYIETDDLNEDGVTDYVIDARGYICGKQADNLFGGSSGKPIYVYVSTRDKSWRKEYTSYIYEYQIKHEYGELPFLDVWVRGDVGYKVNMQRYQWNGDELELFDQEPGVEVPTQLWKRFD